MIRRTNQDLHKIKTMNGNVLLLTTYEISKLNFDEVIVYVKETIDGKEEIGVVLAHRIWLDGYAAQIVEVPQDGLLANSLQAFNSKRLTEENEQKHKARKFHRENDLPSFVLTPNIRECEEKQTRHPHQHKCTCQKTN